MKPSDNTGNSIDLCENPNVIIDHNYFSSTVTISILSLNVCGIVNKLNNPIFVDYIVNYDILCFTEVKIDDTQIAYIEDIFENYGFKIHVKTRCKLSKVKSGGLLIAYKKIFSNNIVLRKSTSNCGLWIQVNKKCLNFDKDLIIGCIYIPPYNSVYADINDFNGIHDDLVTFDINNKLFLLCGDFNSHTGIVNDLLSIDKNVADHAGLSDLVYQSMNIYKNLELLDIPCKRYNTDKLKIDNYGHKLIELCKYNSLCIFNGRAGKDRLHGASSTKHGTVVDYCIGSLEVLSKVHDFYIDEFDSIFSDVHCKVICKLSCSTGIVTYPTNKNENVNQTKSKLWSDIKKQQFIINLNKDKVQNFILNYNNGVKYDVNDCTNLIQDVLINSATDTFSNSNLSNNKKKNFVNSKIHQFYSKECNMLKREYYKAKNVYKKNKNDVNYNVVKEKSKLYKKEVLKNKKINENKFHSKLRSLRSELWNLLNSKKKPDVSVSVNDFYNHFKLSSDENVHSNGTLFDNDVTESNLDTDILNCPFTEAEIIKAVKCLKNGKSAGIDKILNEYIVNSIQLLLPVYVILFNQILEDGKMPEDWLKGIIVPVYKNKGDVTDPNNYRAITLLSCVSKLFTSVLNTRLTGFIDDNNLLNVNQAGFRKGFSTTDHIFLFNAIINLFCFKKRKLYCAFIDYSKAFDSIWREALWHKLIKIGINGKILVVLKNMYSDIKSCVRVNQNMSDFFISLSGLRQGENLSPILFSLFVDDLENYLISNGNDFINFDIDFDIEQFIKILVLMYADDTVIFSNSKEMLQQGLNNLHNYCALWNLNVNSSKTKVTIFGNRKTNISNIKFYYNDELLEIVDSFKYLGVIFNYNGNFGASIKHMADQGTKAMFSLLSKSRRLNLPLDIHFELFDKLVTPVLTHGCETWGFGNINKIESVLLTFLKYSLCLKKCTTNSMLYGESGTFPLIIGVKTRIISYWGKMIAGRQDKLNYIIYKILLQLYIENIFKSPWLIFVHTTLIECGMVNLWTNQYIPYSNLWLKETVKQKLKDIFINKWYSDMSNSNSCIIYRHIKPQFCTESYFNRLPKNLSIILCKFRVNNFKLPIVRGRYSNIERHMRYCDFCSDNKVGDEYHILLECQSPIIKSLRIKYLPKYYSKHPSMFKFISLFEICNSDKKIELNLCFLLKEIQALCK